MKLEDGPMSVSWQANYSPGVRLLSDSALAVSSQDQSVWLGTGCRRNAVLEQNRGTCFAYLYPSMADRIKCSLLYSSP